jgi:hypothetical protein
LRYERDEKKPSSALDIKSDNAKLDTDLATLGLNASQLPQLREAAWQAFNKRFKKAAPGQYGKGAKQAFLQRELGAMGSRLPPFLGVLQAKLRQS